MGKINGWHIATIRGVKIKIHFSLLFALAYIALIAAAQFPAVLQEVGLIPADVKGGPFVWGCIFGVALFMSVLLHELGHVFMAQHLGVGVRGITLMMLGGFSEMNEMPQEHYRELKISIVGPIVSFAIAAVLFIAHRFVSDPSLLLFTYWLGRVNIVLGIFNLLPAFPMDGGRVLRSLLAGSRDPAQATRTAVRFGKMFAWVLGAIGLLQFNIFLMLIALFLWGSAQGELMISQTRAILQGVTAGELAFRVEPIHEAAVLTHVAERMLAARTLVLPALNAEGEAAIVTLEAMGHVPRHEWGFRRARDVMEPASGVALATTKVDELMGELGSAPSSVLPVVEQGKLIGLLRFTDLSDMVKFRSLERVARGRGAGSDGEDEQDQGNRAA